MLVDPVTIPAQRGYATSSDLGGDVSPTVLTLISEGLREVKDAVHLLGRDMNEQLSKMPEAYVPRREVERRFDDVTIDLGALAGRCDRMEKGVEDAERRREATATAAAAEAKTARRWLITTSLTAGSALVGVVGGITIHFT